MTNTAFTDELLKEAIAGYLKAEAAELPENAPLPLYSQAHKERMQSIFAAFRRKDLRKKTRLSIAAALAVFVLSVGMLAAVSPSVYAALESWTLNISNRIVDYRFAHTEDDHAFIICAPGSLPEGFVRTDNYHSGYYTRSTYKNEETGDYLRMEYRRPTEKQKAKVENRGASAELLTDMNRIFKYYEQSGETSNLFWYDPYRELVFSVETSLGKDILKESFETMDMRLPLYEPTWIPEGYKEIVEERMNDAISVGLLFADQDSQPTIVYDCYDMASFNGLAVERLGDDVETEKLIINGNVAFYHPGTEHAPGNDLIMIDEDNNLVLTISSLLSKEDAVEMMRSVICTEVAW